MMQKPWGQSITQNLFESDTPYAESGTKVTRRKNPGIGFKKLDMLSMIFCHGNIPDRHIRYARKRNLAERIFVFRIVISTIA